MKCVMPSFTSSEGVQPGVQVSDTRDTYLAKEK